MGLQTFPAPATFARFPLAGFEPLSPHGSAAPPLLSAASPPAVSPPEVSARKTGARSRHLSRGGVEGKASRHPGDANVPTVPARRWGGAGPRGGFRRSGRVAFATSGVRTIPGRVGDATSVGQDSRFAADLLRAELLLAQPSGKGVASPDRALCSCGAGFQYWQFREFKCSCYMRTKL